MHEQLLLRLQGMIDLEVLGSRGKGPIDVKEGGGSCGPDADVAAIVIDACPAGGPLAGASTSREARKLGAVAPESRGIHRAGYI